MTLLAAALLGAASAYGSGDLSDVSDLGPPEPAFSNGRQFASINQTGTANSARVDQAGLNGISVLQQGASKLAALHCDQAQGFLLSKPLPAAAFQQFLSGLDRMSHGEPKTQTIVDAG